MRKCDLCNKEIKTEARTSDNQIMCRRCFDDVWWELFTINFSLPEAKRVTNKLWDYNKLVIGYINSIKKNPELWEEIKKIESNYALKLFSKVRSTLKKNEHTKIINRILEDYNIDIVRDDVVQRGVKEKYLKGCPYLLSFEVDKQEE